MGLGLAALARRFALLVAGCCWLLLAVAGCCWLLLAVAGCSCLVSVVCGFPCFFLAFLRSSLRWLALACTGLSLFIVSFSAALGVFLLWSARLTDDDRGLPSGN